MKVVETKCQITQSTPVKKLDAKIEMNAFTFKMLAKQYSRPIEAIVQELCANAHDSHVRAGKEDVPFSVTLPSAIVPYFKVRDYGVSMSPETIETVYLTYMSSDKRKSNTEHGCFGLGSKTPLAYSGIDQFNITTYLDGVARFYTFGYGTSGCPELTLFHECESDEPQGVEISLPVQPQDFSAFEYAAKKKLRYYPVLPIGIDITKPEMVLSGNGWSSIFDIEKFKADEKFYHDNNSYNTIVVMGHIPYTVQTNHSFAKYFTLFFDIGDLSVVPSREAIEMNQENVAKINAKFDLIIKEFTVHVNDFLKASNLSAYSKNYFIKTLFERHPKLLNISDLDKGVYYEMRKFYTVSPTININNYIYTYNTGSILLKETDNKDNTLFCIKGRSFAKNYDYQIVIDDNNCKPASRKRRINKLKNTKTNFCLVEGLTKNDVIEIMGYNDEEAAKYVVFISEIADDYVAKKGVGVRVKNMRKVFNYTLHKTNGAIESRHESIDVSQPYFYLVNDSHLCYNYVKIAFDIAKLFNISINNIVVFTESEKPNQTGINFEQYLLDIVKGNDVTELSKLFIACSNHDKIKNFIRHTRLITNKATKDSYLAKYVLWYNNYIEINSNFQACFRRVYNCLVGESQEDKVIESFIKYANSSNMNRFVFSVFSTDDRYTAFHSNVVNDFVLNFKGTN